VETLGPWSNDALSLLDELGKLLSNTTGIPQAKTYLKQRISIAIQRGNAASVIGTVPYLLLLKNYLICFNFIYLYV
jgi:hypothetical protein